MDQKNYKGWLKHWDFILIDLICLQVCFIAAYCCLHHGIRNPYSTSASQFQAVLLAGCQLLVILFTSNYSGILKRRRFDEAMAVLTMMIETLILAFFLMFIMHNSQTASRLQIGFTSVFYVIFDYLLRQLNKKQLIHIRRDDSRKKHLVLFTSAKLVEEARQKLNKADSYQDFILSRIVLLDSEIPAAFLHYDIPVTVNNEETLLSISHEWVDEVFILQPEDYPIPSELIDTVMEMGITVSFTMAALSSDKWQNTQVRKIGSYKVLTNGVHFVNPGQMIVKRLIDILGGLVGCLATGILFLFIAPAIYLSDPGPIFFSQTRIGKNGQKFKVHKFRSMYMDAEERKAKLMAQNRIKDGMMFKMDDDPRIIGSEKKKKNGKPGGIGNFIRNTSLDEFPQFYDVLIGNMSLVGWRPCTLDEWDKYELKHRIRASMKPGITGMWQVSGRSTITDFEEVVRLDRHYIENWNLALDLKILLKTVVVVLNRRGAE